MSREDARMFLNEPVASTTNLKIVYEYHIRARHLNWFKVKTKTKNLITNLLSIYTLIFSKFRGNVNAIAAAFT